jgi:hypothetical protein
VRIYCVRIGDRYGPEYEEYLEEKLSDYEIVWIREPRQSNVMLQWNKMFAMEDDSQTPIVVMDIDVLLLNDYKELFEYPIERGEFLTIDNWWSVSDDRFYINGGFYKYYPEDVKYVLERFLEDPEYYQYKYIKEGYTSGPVNGEQHFIQDTVSERLKIKLLPKEWLCRVDARKENSRQLMRTLNREYTKLTGNEYMFMGNKFHPDIKLVHFTNMANHPHNWEKYHLFK